MKQLILMLFFVLTTSVFSQTQCVNIKVVHDRSHPDVDIFYVKDKPMREKYKRIRHYTHNLTDTFFLKSFAKVYRDCFSTEEINIYKKMGLDSRIYIDFDLNGEGVISNISVKIFKKHSGVRMTKKQFLIFRESVIKNVIFKLPSEHKDEKHLRLGIGIVVF